MVGKWVEVEVKFVFGYVLIFGLIDVMMGIGFLFVLFYGGIEIIVGEKIVGEFMVFFIVMVLVFELFC